MIAPITVEDLSSWALDESGGGGGLADVASVMVEDGQHLIVSHGGNVSDGLGWPPKYNESLRAQRVHQMARGNRILASCGVFDVWET